MSELEQHHRSPRLTSGELSAMTMLHKIECGGVLETGPAYATRPSRMILDTMRHLLEAHRDKATMVLRAARSYSTIIDRPAPIENMPVTVDMAVVYSLVGQWEGWLDTYERYEQLAAEIVTALDLAHRPRIIDPLDERGEVT